jgi:hypothetical protein
MRYYEMLMAFSPRVDHIDTMLEGNANDIVLREVRRNGS